MGTPLWWSRDLSAGDRGEDVRAFQRLTGLPLTGLMDELTVQAVRALQGRHPTGVLDADTAALVGDLVAAELTPAWWSPALLEGEQAWGPLLGGRDEAWLRRFQSQHGVPPTGVLDEVTARLLAGALEVA